MSLQRPVLTHYLEFLTLVTELVYDLACQANVQQKTRLKKK